MHVNIGDVLIQHAVYLHESIKYHATHTEVYIHTIGDHRNTLI